MSNTLSVCKYGLYYLSFYTFYFGNCSSLSEESPTEDAEDDKPSSSKVLLF